jgi:hypothetical protein
LIKLSKIDTEDEKDHDDDVDKRSPADTQLNKSNGMKKCYKKSKLVAIDRGWLNEHNEGPVDFRNAVIKSGRRVSIGRVVPAGD